MNDAEMRTALARIRVVLSRPRDPENVGSVCRAMKTMGIRDLRIVGDVEFDQERARAVAVHSDDVLDRARWSGNLGPALAGCSFIVGTTRRWGKRRKSVRLTPYEVADRIVESPLGETALVFGNESSGLSDDEIDRCHVVATIPSEPDARSLNLSHAVQILCYEIYARFHAAAGKRYYRPLSGERLEETVDAVVASLGEMRVEADRYEPLIREIVARAALSRTEADRFRALFEKLAGLSRKRAE